MQFRELRYLIKSDLYRYSGKVNTKNLLINLIFNPGFKYSFWMRVKPFFKQNVILKYPFYLITHFILKHYAFKYGIDIPATTSIGSGFYIGHFGCIVVNHKATIGKNCNISQGVTIGQANRGKRQGYPTIGDNVYIGPGAKIVGNVVIGNNVAIGANCVVTNDIPNDAVVVGVPGKVISYKGSEGYINRIDY